MIPYILKASLILSFCYLFYQLMLKNETFFRLHRWYFLGCILSAFIVPLLPVPEIFSGQENWSVMDKVHEVYAEASPAPAPVTAEPESFNGAPPAASGTAEAAKTLNIYQVAMIAYWFGLVIFGSILLAQIVSVVYSIVKNRKSIIKDGSVYIVETGQDKSPYSFLNFIFINPEKYEWDAYNQIIEHEKVHANQRHTLDIFLAELTLVLQWFNPFAWIYRKTVENNLEFLTDETLVRTYDSSSKESYQLNLVKVAVPNFPMGIATSFNQLLIKKRIQMINTKRSSIKSMWKYPFILPVFLLAMLLFNNPTTSQSQNIVKVDPQPTNSFNNMIDMDHFLENFVMDQDLSKVMQGKWDAGTEGDNVCFRFYDGEGANVSWSTMKCIDRKELKLNAGGGQQEFQLARTAGTISFKGSLTNGKGNGTYTFKENGDFRTYLESQDIKGIQNGAFFFAALTDINREYVEYLDSKGYQLNEKLFTALAFPDIHLNYLKDQLDFFGKAGYGKPSLMKVSALKTLGIDEQYFQSLRDLGYEKLSVDEVISSKAMGIDVDYIKAFKEKEGRLPSIMELLALKTFPNGQMN